MTRTARFPFSFRQRVKHEAYPEVDFIVLAQEADHTGEWTISVSDSSGGGFWRFPQYELTFADLANEQEEMAKWLGCDVDRMNELHDPLHEWLALQVGAVSYSLKWAAGERLTPEEAAIAADEESAVLALQKYLCTIERAGTKIKELAA